MRVGGIGAFDDELRRGPLRHRVKQQVLHGGEEGLGGAIGLVVVHAQGEQVAHLLVEALLRGADVADARQHLVEVVRASVRILQALVIHDRSEEHTSELQSLMRISYAVFCLKKKKNYNNIVLITRTTM